MLVYIYDDGSDRPLTAYRSREEWRAYNPIAADELTDPVEIPDSLSNQTLFVLAFNFDTSQSVFYSDLQSAVAGMPSSETSLLHKETWGHTTPDVWYYDVVWPTPHPDELRETVTIHAKELGAPYRYSNPSNLVIPDGDMLVS